MNILYLFSLNFCTNQFPGNSEPLTYDGLRNILSGFTNHFLQHVADSEERTLKYINKTLESKFKDEMELHTKLLDTMCKFKKKEQERGKNDSMALLIPLLKAMKIENTDNVLLSLLTSKGADNKMLPFLIHLMSSGGTTTRSQQQPNQNILLTTLLSRLDEDGDNDKTLLNYLLYQTLSEKQDQTCPVTNQNPNLYGPSTSSAPFIPPTIYGPSLNVNPPPTVTYGPSPAVNRDQCFPNVATSCPPFQESCPLNQGIETREYGKNYGRRP